MTPYSYVISFKCATIWPHWPAVNLPVSQKLTTEKSFYKRAKTPLPSSLTSITCCFFPVPQFQPLSPHQSPQLSLLVSRKPLAWLWEAVSCLQKKKERFPPRSGCSLDTVFCLCTITGTQGAARRAFALLIFADAGTKQSMLKLP